MKTIYTFCGGVIIPRRIHSGTRPEPRIWKRKTKKERHQLEFVSNIILLVLRVVARVWGVVHISTKTNAGDCLNDIVESC